MGKHRKFKMITAIILSLILLVSLLPAAAMAATEEKDTTTDFDKTITGLCTGEIADPTPGEGGWCMVYYGKIEVQSEQYNVWYRVLTTHTSDFGGNTMFLDCDNIVHMWDYDDANWEGSNIQSWLNNDFAQGFTDLEYGAIYESTKESKNVADGDGYIYADYQPLNGEKIFLLDFVEITRESYGYGKVAYGADRTRIKEGTDYKIWWLRSHGKEEDWPNSMGAVNYEGWSGLQTLVNLDLGESVDDLSVYGISPAMNIDLDQIIFSSYVSGNGTGPNGYKLTLKDPNLSIGLQEGKTPSQEGRKFTIPYVVSGSDVTDATQVTVLVTDKEYMPHNSADAKVLQYTALDTESGNIGTFTLDDSITGDPGKDYYVYILAENINSDKNTDYASEPFKITHQAGWEKGTDGWYRYDETGLIRIKSQWIQENNKWYYLTDTGLMATGWVKYNGKWYYMDSSGAMQTGWKKINGTWYYMDSSGAMKTGWLKDGNKWYFLNKSSGAMMTGWVSDGGKWYYMNSAGSMVTGWVSSGGKWYYMNSSGAMVTGWIAVGGKWYYMKPSGEMTTGWFNINGTWYYFRPSGEYATKIG